MKKLFVSILALAAFAACQSDFNDVNFDTPQGGSNVNVGGAHTVYAEVGVGEEDTKATYGDGLKATWEQGDQLALLQEHADYNKTFSVVNKLNIKDGWGTSKALFNGDISVDATAPRVYHIAYPASAVSFNTSLSLTKGESTYTTQDSGSILGSTMAYYAAAATYNYKYVANLNITVPTEQNGKWEPYMYASTSEAVSSEGIGAKELTTLTGAIAIRAFESDGVTPKQLKSITITSSDAAIAGAFTGSSESSASLHIQGAYTSDDYSTVRDEDTGSTMPGRTKGKAEADKLLQSAAQAYEPASTSVTKAMSLSFNGTGKSITATNLEAIASEDDGNYTYHVNVAPATLAAGTLTIVAVDANGSSLTRVVNKDVVIAASHRVGFNLTWESATLKGATIESWYNDWNKGSQFQLAGSTLYVDNISVEGNIAADHVKAIGVRINGEFHSASAQSGVLAISPIVIEGLSSGVYTVQPVAQVELNGELKWLEGGEVTKTVTSIPTVIDYSVRTSYSSNGSVAKTNDINGDILKVKANLSDSYVANNLVNGKNYTICYGSNTATQTLGSEKEITLAHGAWGQYVCYVKISLANGYVIESQKFTTHVTGIPYSVNLDGASSVANWSNNRTSNHRYLCLKEGTAYTVSMPFGVPTACNVVVTIPMYAYGGSIYGSYKPYVYASATSSTSGSASGTSIQLKGSNSLPGGASYTTWTPTVTLSNTAPRLSIYANGSKYWSSVGGGDMGVIMKSITVNYQL